MSERMELMEVMPDKRTDLIKGLVEKGIESPEVLKALTTWTIEQEKKVEAAGRTPEARIDFELERAKIYAESNYIAEAIDALYDALYVAQQENRAELERRIRGEIALLESVE